MTKYILDGGWYKKDENSVSKNILVRCMDFLLENLKLGKKLLIITNAKPVDYYKERILPLLNLGAEYIGRNTSMQIDWGKYDIILTLGGDQKILYDELERMGFKVMHLKNSALYIGESAGAMVLGSYFYYDYDEIDKEPSFAKGFRPEDNVIYLVHNDNPIYSPDFLKTSVQKFAKDNNLKIVFINENEVIEK
jgi:hypothetical protein